MDFHILLLSAVELFSNCTFIKPLKIYFQDTARVLTCAKEKCISNKNDKNGKFTYSVIFIFIFINSSLFQLHFGICT